jgi:hypothetical protein
VSLPARVTVLIVAFVLVVAGAVFVVAHYLLAEPPTLNYTAAPGQPVNITLQVDPQAPPYASHPFWPTYIFKSPTTGAWVQTTLFTVPAGHRIIFHLYEFDGATPLRNPLWSKVTGTVGDVEYVGAKRTPYHVLPSWTATDVAHTFAIPSLDVMVPLYPTQASSLCPLSPCSLTQPKTDPYSLDQFSIMAPKTPGAYRWQCFIPCGLGFVDGFGGPMQTIGYMTGTMQVVAP